MTLSELTQQLRALLEQTAELQPEALEDETIQDRLKLFEAQADALSFIIGIGNPKLITCDMPHNNHSFKSSNRTKHCTYCNSAFCPDHALMYCVACGRIL